MVWDGVMFDHRTPLVHIDGCLTEGRCVTLVEPIVLPLLQDAPHTVFDTDNDRPHELLTARLNLRFLPGQQTLDLNSIEHMWNLIGRDMDQVPLS
ncbi:hypothetical protein TNCV_1552851 [Trichonephila clavipes]|nr:hypothetical protein TNCV_1552851 [Trichonephila clavipes]